MLFLIVQTFIFLYPTCTQHSSATEIVMNMKDDYIISSIAAENIISAPATSKSEWLNFRKLKCLVPWFVPRIGISNAYAALFPILKQWDVLWMSKKQLSNSVEKTLVVPVIGSYTTLRKTYRLLYYSLLQ